MMKAHWESGGITPLISNLITRWRWVVSYMSQPYCLLGSYPYYLL